ncbi:MAG: hypothetical protein ACYTGZ_15965, partial [Planctomycetota bacterium]
MKRTILILAVLAATLAHAQERPKVWVHAPAEDLLGLFPDKGAGFLISIGEYNRLRELAEKNRAATEAKPPLAARLVRGAVHGTIQDDKLLLEGEYSAVVQGDGPAELPFTVAGIALTSITIDEGGTYVGGQLRFAKPGTYRVKVKFAKQLDKRARGDLKSAAFLLPPAAAHAVNLLVPPRMEGEVGPIVRAFTSGTEPGRVTGYPDRRGLFKFWMRPRTRARQLEPIVSTTFAVMASVGETRTLASTRIELEILRAPLKRVRLELAKGQLVHALQGKGVKTWKLVRGNPRDGLEIEFVEPVENKVVLTLETELPRENPAVAALPFPQLPGAVRYRGTVGLIARPEVRLTGLQSQGARRLDKVPKQGIALYEVFSPNATLAVDVEAVASKTRAESFHYLHLGEGGKTLLTRVVYRIAGKPLFRLVPRVPAGWILRGQVLLDGRAHPHRLEKDGRLILEFPNGLNPGAHVLQLRLDTDEVDWVPEQGKAPFAFSDTASGLAEESGKLAVGADPAFRVGVATSRGVRTIGLNELGIAVGTQTLFAWAFDTADFAVSFDTERNEPQLTATVIQRVMPRETLLKMHTTVALKIERAGIRELKIALPKGTGKTVDFQGDLIKERKPPEEGADPEVWTLKFQRRILGLYRLDVVFDKTFENDSWDSPVPSLALPGASESGFVVIESSDTSAITVDRGGLREADVAELPEEPARSPLEVLAYAAQPFTVKIASQRHDPHAVVQAIALSAHIYGVLSNGGRLRCRAEYRVRNNDQPFLLCGLPKKSRLLGALVDGQPIKPLLAGGWLKLPLARSKGRETPFVVAVIYESKVEDLGDKAEVTVARPVLDIDVLKTTYTLHLPDGYSLTGHDGDMVPMDKREQETILGDLGALAAQPMAMGADSSRATVDETLNFQKSFLTEEDGDGIPEVAVVGAPARGAARPRSEPAAARDNAEQEAIARYKQLSREDRTKVDAGLRSYLARTQTLDNLKRTAGESQQDKLPAEQHARAKKMLELLDRVAPKPKASGKNLDKARAPEKKSKAGFKSDARRKQADEKAKSGRYTADYDVDGEAEQPHEDPAATTATPAADGPTTPQGGGRGASKGRRWKEARGGAAGTPPEPSPQPQGKKKRARPERALLSLDVQFL